MPAFPDPSIDSIWQNAALSGIRMDKVWTGIQEILANKLPGMVARYNAENLRTGDEELDLPVDYYTGGADLHEKPLPAIVVGSEVEFSPFGGGVHLGENTACVWVVTKAKMNEKTARDASLLAQLCYFIVQEYQAGYMNEAGQRLWLTLNASAVKAIPKNDQSLYGGFFVPVAVTQGPSPDTASLYTQPAG